MTLKMEAEEFRLIRGEGTTIPSDNERIKLGAHLEVEDGLHVRGEKEVGRWRIEGSKEVEERVDWKY